MLAIFNCPLPIGNRKSVRESVEKLEIALGTFYIFANLFAQGIGRGKLDFIPQAFQEMDLDFSFRGEFNRVKVQQVGFDGEGVRAESRAIADVGDGVEAFFGNAGASDVNTVFRNQFLVSAQVDGGNGVFGAIATAAACGRQNAKRASQQVSRAADTPLGDQFANVTT